MPSTVEPASGSVSFDKTFIKIGLHAPVVAASVVATGLWLVIVIFMVAVADKPEVQEVDASAT